MKRRIIGIILGVFILCTQAYAASFVAKKIEFQGLQRINHNTAMSYLPVKPGAKINSHVSDQIIHDLYKTGFFSNVSLSRKNDALIVQVQERPIISKLSISGNKVVPSKQLIKVLKQMDIAEGYEYNRSTLKKIKTALLGEYYSHGKYNAKVNINVVKRQDNSVHVEITISEGLTATIKQINIIGNHAYSEDTLLGEFQLSTPGWLSFFSHDDEYSSQKLSADLESLKSYYLNRGYLKFKIQSSHVSISPDRKHVYITVHVHEGPQYKFAGYHFKGKLILPSKQLDKLVQVKKGEIFSKQKIVSTEQAIGDALGSKGYAKADISTHSSVNEKNKTIEVTFHVHPGPRVYVRHVHFVGNSGTNDFAFRRELTQMEGGLINTKAIKNSKQNLLQLPFVNNVQTTTKAVSGQNNEEDIDYKISTVPAGEVKAGVGFSDVDGLLFNAGIHQQNVFGTGNAFSVGASYSASMFSGQISYNNPYYTKWGVGRGFSLYGSHYNADQANIADYTTDNYGGSVNYSIPLAQYDSLQFSVGLNYLYLHTGSTPADTIQNFIDKHGRSFTQIPINLGWNHNSLNRSVFPTNGLVQNANVALSAPVSNDSLEYYKLTYGFVFYHPLYHSFLAKLRGDVGYGGGYGNFDRLPFMKNFYAGGIGSVRGYSGNTIGPQDSHADSIGGNLFFDASLGVVVPNPLSHSLRTTWFVDAGNVYDTKATSAQEARNPDRNTVRFSTGVEFDWLSPLGMLNFSLAKAINPSKQDDTQIFQFNIGTSF